MSDEKIVISKNYANIEPSTKTEPKKQKKRVRYSIFFLTWNSNKPISDINDPEFQDLEAHAEQYWANFANNIKDYINILEGDIDKIKLVSVNPAFEIGDNKRCFHAHIAIRVEHYTKIKLNLEKIRAELPGAIPMAVGYIQVRGCNDSKATLEDYIQKYRSKST